MKARGVDGSALVPAPGSPLGAGAPPAAGARGAAGQGPAPGPGLFARPDRGGRPGGRGPGPRPGLGCFGRAIAVVPDEGERAVAADTGPEVVPAAARPDFERAPNAPALALHCRGLTA